MRRANCSLRIFSSSSDNSAADFVRFLAAWQQADPAHCLDGTAGVLEVVRQLAGFEAPAPLWESKVLPLRVRGYDRESLGPQEFLGTAFQRPLGGEALLVLNEELRFPLPWDLTGLVFFDAGQVWDRPGDAGSELAKSLGLGLRAHTPLGLLRIDAAHPIDRRPTDGRYGFYVGFGNAF